MLSSGWMNDPERFEWSASLSQQRSSVWQRCSGLALGIGRVSPYHAVYRWVELHDWTRPSVPLTHEAERIVGVANEQLAGCRPSEVVLEDFLGFLIQKHR